MASQHHGTSGTNLILIVVNKKPWFSARLINTEFIVKLWINRGLPKIHFYLFILVGLTSSDAKRSSVEPQYYSTYREITAKDFYYSYVKKHRTCWLLVGCLFAACSLLVRKSRSGGFSIVTGLVVVLWREAEDIVIQDDSDFESMCVLSVSQVWGLPSSPKVGRSF